MTQICKTHFRPHFWMCPDVSLYTKYIYNLMYYISIYILGSRLILRGSEILTHLKMFVGVTTKKMCLQDVSTLDVSTFWYVSTPKPIFL